MSVGMIVALLLLASAVGNVTAAYALARHYNRKYQEEHGQLPSPKEKKKKKKKNKKDKKLTP